MKPINGNYFIYDGHGFVLVPKVHCHKVRLKGYEQYDLFMYSAPAKPVQGKATDEDSVFRISEGITGCALSDQTTTPQRARRSFYTSMKRHKVSARAFDKQMAQAIVEMDEVGIPQVRGWKA